MTHIAVAHPWLGSGGSEARAMWCMQALRDAGHRVSVLSYAGPEALPALNLQHGTSLRPGDLQWHEVPFLLPHRSHGGLARLRWRGFERYCAAVAQRFDAFISAYNPLDVDVPSIHFVADFSWDEGVRLRLDPAAAPTGWRRALQRPYGWLTRPRRPASEWLGRHLVVANSRWTAARLGELYGLSGCPVIHPPVMDVEPPDAGRDPGGFLWLGRAAPEKRLDDAVAIMEGVRAAGHEAELWVAGDFAGSEYGRRVARGLRRVRWVRFFGHVVGAEKRALLARARFGLHTRPCEPFGIAVAELMKAGSIVFAPDAGGPGEMLEGTPLLFGDVAHARRLIVRTLEAPESWSALSSEVASRGRRYSNTSFCEAVLALVSRLGRS